MTKYGHLSNEQCKEMTPAGLLVEKGHAHLPLGLEELTKAHFSTQYRAEYFMNKNDNDENVFEQWLTDNKDKLKVNAYDVKNHEIILLRWPGSEKIYNRTKPTFTKMIVKNISY